MTTPVSVPVSCPGVTYVSWGIDGDDGLWVVRGECDGPRSCGFERLLDTSAGPSSGGLNSQSWDRLHAEHLAHRTGPSPESATP